MAQRYINNTYPPSALSVGWTTGGNESVLFYPFLKFVYINFWHTCEGLVGKSIAICGLVFLSALGAAHAVVVSKSILLFWISLTPLLLAIRTLRPVRSARYGFLWGVCFQLFLTLFSGSLTGVSLFSMFFISATAALYTAIGVSVVRHFKIGPMALGLGWIAALPIIRLVSLNFGFFPISFSADNLILIVAEYLGCSVIAFVVIYLNALLVMIAGIIIYRLYCKLNFRIYRFCQFLVHLKSIIFSSSFSSHTFRPRAPPLAGVHY